MILRLQKDMSTIVKGEGLECLKRWEAAPHPILPTHPPLWDSPPPPQHLLLTLRGGALPSPLVAHSMYTIHYTIRNIHCQQKHITSLWRVRANKTWKHLSRVTDQELWVRVCKKWFCPFKIHLACCFILISYSLTESRVSGSRVFFLCFLAQT